MADELKTLREAVAIMIIAFLLTMILPGHAQTVTTSAPRHVITNQNKVDQIGVGAQLGSTSGVTADFWDSSHTSFEASVVSGYGNVGVDLARQWKFPGTFGGEANILVPYLGAGVLAVFGNERDQLEDRTQKFALATQVPMGFDVLPRLQRFGAFAELKPSLEITPDMVAFLNADVGARFYF